MISAMRDLTVGVFEHLETTPEMDVDKIIKYTERILIVTVLNKYRQVLEECKDLAKGTYGDHWNLGSAKSVTMKQFWVGPK